MDHWLEKIEAEFALLGIPGFSPRYRISDHYKTWKSLLTSCCGIA